MILKPLFGLSLVLNVSLDAQNAQTPVVADPARYLQMSVRQRDAALLPLVQRANECVARKVTADPRCRADLRPADINDLIVHSIGACARPVRAMIDAHDRMWQSIPPRALSRRAAVGSHQAGES